MPTARSKKEQRSKILPALALLLAVVSPAFAAAPALPAPFTPPLLPPKVDFPSSKIIAITDTGAVPDGKTLVTNAINKAIDQCAAAGGGIVQFPKILHENSRGAHQPTEYLTGPIHLKSNITLQIDEGVTLKFSSDRSLYPVVKTRYEAVDVMNFSPLIYAYQCENIRITGKGTIDGQGSDWWAWARTASARAPRANAAPLPPLRGADSGQGVGPNPDALRTMLDFTNDRAGRFPLETRILGNTIPGFRPCLVEPYGCKNVLIEGVTLRQSPFWTIHPVYSTNVTVRNCTVIGDGPNTDGCDPDSCNTVLIENTAFTTGDDCIAIKSGRDGDGIRRNAPCENITIRNCTMKGGHGAITMGSETSAGIRNVFAENCQVDGPDSAIRLKSTRGRGGGIENIYIRNITTTRTLKYAITIDMFYSKTAPAPKSETTPVFKNIRIENFTCENAPQAIYVMGLPESPVENLTLKNITIKGDKGAHLEQIRGLTRENVTVTPKMGEAWEIKDVTDALPSR